jgi:hypothetical protein
VECGVSYGASARCADDDQLSTNVSSLLQDVDLVQVCYIFTAISANAAWEAILQPGMQRGSSGRPAHNGTWFSREFGTLEALPSIYIYIISIAYIWFQDCSLRSLLQCRDSSMLGSLSFSRPCDRDTRKYSSAPSTQDSLVCRSC